MFRAIAAIAALSFASCGVDEDQISGSVMIYYVPIGAETFVPVTPENVESSYMAYAKMEVGSPEIHKIMSLISSTENGEFDGEMVRVKLSFSDGQKIFIDNEGGVRNSSGDFSLTQRKLLRLKKELEKVVKPRR
jgi:hypothetical protein